MKQLTKSMISENVAAIKKAMNYPSRMTNEIMNDEVGRALNSEVMFDEVQEKVTAARFPSDIRIVELFYHAAAELNTLSTAKITEYVYQKLKEMNSPENMDENELYETIIDYFADYKKSHYGISQYTIEFFNDPYDYFPGIIDAHNTYERNAENIYSRSYRNPVSFMDVSEIEYLFRSAIADNKIDNLFTECNKTFIQFQNEIAKSTDKFYMMCFEVGVSLSNIYSAFRTFGTKAI